MQATPAVHIRPAPPMRFPGAGPPAVGETDCNSPAHWDGETFYLFNSAGHPWRSSGPDLFHLTETRRRVEYDNAVQGGRWIESTWKADDGTLYGWYHFEPAGVCPEVKDRGLTAPRIGAVSSRDNGLTWHDLGVVLDAPPGTLRCDTRNYYFAGGNGDFSVILDRNAEWLYFLMSTYWSFPEQGVSLARMRWNDRDRPVGRVWKWRDGRWAEPGLGGRVTPIFPARIDWHREDADALWGPAVHWNTHLAAYVVLLNRAVDKNWKQEGIYVTFCQDLANPRGFTSPARILDSPGPSAWYPQVIGTDRARRETDKLAGRTARLFVRGESRWEIEFQRPAGR